MLLNFSLIVLMHFFWACEYMLDLKLSLFPLLMPGFCFNNAVVVVVWLLSTNFYAFDLQNQGSYNRFQAKDERL